MRIIKLEKEGCTPCQFVSNYLDSKGIEYERIDVFVRPEVAMRFEAMGVPVTILLDENDNEVKRVVGYKPAELEQLINMLNQ